MKFVPLLITSALCTATLMSNAFASEEWARVKHSEPLYGQATQTQRQGNCSQQWVAKPVTRPQQGGNPNIGGAILGTILGGVIGNQFGGGDGKAAMTAIGGGIGAVIGSQQGSNEPQQQPQQEMVLAPVECQTITEMQPAPLVGYRITLEYNGKDIVYQSQTPPRSDYVRVNVQVTPMPER